jgi:hypothetical protein
MNSFGKNFLNTEEPGGLACSIYESRSPVQRTGTGVSV